MKAIHTTSLLMALAFLALPAAADDDGERRERRHGHDFKQQYRDGNCKVERKQDKGGYEEKVECKGGAHGDGRRHARSEFKEEYREGNCKVKRELQKDGDYKEERKCKGHSHAHAAAPVQVVQPPVVVLPAPVVVQPGVTVQGTIHVK
jgi:hypothetical protein